MSLVISKAEIAAVDKELHEPADDSEELAKRIIKAFLEVREERTIYYAISQEKTEQGAFFAVHGPFPTRKGAEKFVDGRESFRWAFSWAKSLKNIEGALEAGAFE